MFASAAALLCVMRAHAGQTCPVPDVDGGRPFPPPLSNDAPACASLLSYVPHLSALERGAGFPPGRWRVAVQRYDLLDNVYLAERAGLVVVTTGFLARHPAPTPAVIFTLAHELAHAVQEREAPLRADPGAPQEAQDRASRRREAQADSIALELLPRAGYDPALAVHGLEELLTCAAVSDERPSASPHPAPRVRWLNLTRIGPHPSSSQAALSPSLGTADFDDSGRLVASAPDAESERAASRACGSLERGTFEEAVAIGRRRAP